MQLDHFGMYPERAFMKVAGRITLEGGGGKGGSAPPAPDYTGAAQATAAGNKEAAISAQAGNMINQYTPYGSVTYAERGRIDGTPQYSQYVTLSPEQQTAYNKDVAMNAQLQDVGIQGVGYVQSALNKPLASPGQAVGSAGTTQFQSTVPGQQLQTNLQDPSLTQQQVTDALYKQQTQYLDPQFERSGKALENQLANQGITRGSEAWNNAMQESNAQKQQAYESARTQAIGQGVSAGSQMYGNQLAQMQAINAARTGQFGMGLSQAELANQAANQQFAQQLSNAQLQNQAMQQNFANAQTLQQNPINMLNAVRSGSQMQTSAQPQVGVSSPGQLATWSGPDLLGAATAQGQYNQGLYNSQNAASSNQMSGLMGLAGTATMAGATAY